MRISFVFRTRQLTSIVRAKKPLRGGLSFTRWSLMRTAIMGVVVVWYRSCRGGLVPLDTGSQQL